MANNYYAYCALDSGDEIYHIVMNRSTETIPVFLNRETCQKTLSRVQNPEKAGSKKKI